MLSIEDKTKEAKETKETKETNDSYILFKNTKFKPFCDVNLSYNKLNGVRFNDNIGFGGTVEFCIPHRADMPTIMKTPFK